MPRRRRLLEQLLAFSSSSSSSSSSFPKTNHTRSLLHLRWYSFATSTTGRNDRHLTTTVTTTRARCGASKSGTRRDERWERHREKRWRGDATNKAARMKSTTLSSPVQLGSCYAQIVGLGTDTDGKDTAPSVLLFTDKKRYCFNVGEGFQRFCVEHRLKMSRLERVFFTRTTSQATGGLIGMLLTLADAASASVGGAGPLTTVETDDNTSTPKMTVHGPNVRNLLEAVKVLVAENRGVLVERGGETFRDEICEVKPMLRVPEMVGPLGKRLNAADNDNIAMSRKRVSSNQVDLEPVVSYDVQLASPPGKFDVKKADALGVPKGKERGLLVRGESIDITLENGEKKTITPDMCVEMAGRGARFAVVDLPTKAHLDEAIKIVDKMKKSDGWNVNEERDLVVHLAPADVASLSQYQMFVKENFSNAKGKNLFANASRNDRTPIFLASRAVQAKLHGIDASIFPEPPSSSNDGDNGKSMSLGEAGKNLLKFTLLPQRSMGIDESAVPNVETPRSIREEAAKEAELRRKTKRKNADKNATTKAMEANNDFFANHPGHRVVEDVEENEIVVTFLGTGSAQPAKHRNVSGILLEVQKDDENYSALLDSGEGSLGQLYRSKNGDTRVVNKLLKNMHFAWISHIHADHHVGLPSILSKRREAFLSSGVKEEDIPNLIVFGPRPLRWFLSQCEKLEPLNYRFVDCRDTLEEKTVQELFSTSSSSSFSSPFIKLTSIPVNHCAHAFGIKLEGLTNKSCLPYSLVYSGDTRPCANIRDAAKECTLLIHEATFENGLEHEALTKKHSTTAEALEIGSSAYLNILTHFSQRYPKVPSFDGSDGIVSASGQNAMFAFDLMRVDFNNLRRIPSLLPNVRELFEEEKED